MSNLLEDIIAFEKAWETEYHYYYNEAKEIDEEIADYSGKIRTYIDTINGLKRTLEPNIRIINSFLNTLGQIDSPPNFRTYKPESIAEYIQSSYAENANPKTYINTEIPEGGFDKLKQRLSSSRFSNKTLKEALAQHTQSLEFERTRWENDKFARKEKLTQYKSILTITKLYHDVFSMVNDTINTVIIPEIPGIKAFLYAQGVKDAIFSGKLPSESKPVPIKRFMKSAAYTRHVNFVRNTHDFYTLFVGYYENDYLTALINSRGTAKVQKDKESFEQKKRSLKANMVFGGKSYE